MTDIWYPDGASSRALLIGAARYASDELSAIPAVHGNLDSLRDALTDPERGILPVRNCRVVGGRGDRKAATPVSVGAALAAATREATDLLLVYYAGHGLLDEARHLHLALADTDPDPETVSFSAVSALQVRDMVGRSRARARVLILDCCYSGRAVPAMATQGSIIADQLKRTGTYTLTSTTRTELSFSLPGEPCTAFTQALLHALDGSRVPTLDEIYHSIREELTVRGLPAPQRRAVNAAGNLALGRPSERANSVPPAAAPGPPSSQPPDPRTRIVPGNAVFSRPLKTPAQRRRDVRLSWSARLAAPPAVVGFVLLGQVTFAVLTAITLLAMAATFATYARTTVRILTVDTTGLTVSSDPPSEGSHFPWQDILYVGLLRTFAVSGPDSYVTHENLLLVRPRPGAVLTRHRTAAGSPLESLGYHSLGELKDFQADPVLLREAVLQFSPGGYRTNSELLDLDPRLGETAHLPQ